MRICPHNLRHTEQQSINNPLQHALKLCLVIEVRISAIQLLVEALFEDGPNCFLTVEWT